MCGGEADTAVSLSQRADNEIDKYHHFSLARASRGFAGSKGYRPPGGFRGGEISLHLL